MFQSVSPVLLNKLTIKSFVMIPCFVEIVGLIKPIESESELSSELSSTESHEVSEIVWMRVVVAR